MTLPSVPRVPPSTLPSADLIETTDRIDTGRGETPTETDDLGQPPTEAPRFPEISELARKIADFAPGMAGRIQDYVRTTARAGLLLIMILLGCGQGPVQVGPDPGQAQPVIVPAAPAPAPVPPKATTPPVPSRLRVPTTYVEIEGVRVPVGPILDTDTNRPCQLVGQADGSALCVPTDVARIEAATETAFIDIDCTVPTAKLSGRIEAWDGSRVWRYLTGSPPIPSGTAASAQRDPVTGQCRPARVIMAGGDWAFTSVTPAQFLYALIKKLD